MNVELQQMSKTHVPTCPDWQALCVPDLNGGNSSLCLFTEGDDLHDAMISAIDAAQRSIRLEVFIFAADEAGWRFAKALSAKARAGVEVRFHFDSRGAASGYSAELFRQMLDAGVKLKWYRPWSWRHPSRYFQRNHRKLLVIDERELFLGGFNIRRENSRALYGEGRQRDTHVSIRGELARRTAMLFDQMWDDPEHPYADAAKEEPLVFDPLLTPNFACLGWRQIACLYAGLIQNSVRHVYITTPYFCPGSVVARAARQAAGRGVDVRLLVPRYSDPAFVGWLTRSGYSSLIADGVRIYEYLPPPRGKLHAKTAVIDDEWCVVGSPNLDHLSLIVNHELVLIARDRGLGEALRDQYFRDLADAEEVQPSAWAHRGWAERCLEGIGWTARKLL
ncbi:MAG TPA: phosphatidylserine/phosphatidylglycerophosphate/cardiolipin synthase family protein [Candidatus Binatia bacterium]|nr:phosphatidylserine/phosphatidylglycerophosphate/cardiolipin synthase family protein [Candidatus Binatia bacterium]